MRYRPRTNFFIVALAIIALSHGEATASPTRVPVQGHLTDQNGVPIDNVAKNVTIRLYDASIGGNLLHEEARTVSPTQGYFAVYLGAGAQTLDSSVFLLNPDVYVEFAVESTILAPRLLLGTSPYAAYAAVAEQALQPAPGSVDGEAFADPVMVSSPLRVQADNTSQFSVLDVTTGGSADSSQNAIWGHANLGTGVYGFSSQGTGVRGWSAGVGAGVSGQGSGGPGVSASSDYRAQLRLVPSASQCVNKTGAEGDVCADSVKHKVYYRDNTRWNPLLLPPKTVIFSWLSSTDIASNFTNGVGTGDYLGWAICNGSNGTPNLAGRFPRMITTGAGSIGGEDSNNHYHGMNNHTHNAGSLVSQITVEGSTIYMNRTGGGFGYSHITSTGASAWQSGTSGSQPVMSGTTGTPNTNQSGTPSDVENRPAYYELVPLCKI